MRKIHIAAVLSAIVIGGAANAGVFTDDASRCLVTKSSDADKAAFMRWMFAALSAHPAVKDMARIEQIDRAKETARVAKVANRLILEDCRAQFVAALKSEGSSVFQTSFGVFGQAATVGLMNHPDVASQLDGLGNLMDVEQLKSLAREAGLQVSDQPAAKPKQ